MLFRSAKGKKLSRSALTRATRNMTPRERDEAVVTLIEQQKMDMQQEATGGRPRVWYWAL